MPRLTPYQLAFGADSEARFARIRESLARGGRDPHDLDAFVLDREVSALLRELVPEEGVGEAVREHLALLHHAWLYWEAGGWLISPTRDRARRLLAPAAPQEPLPPTADLPRAFYLQLPERLVWADLGDGQPHQPLDGAFIRPWPEGGLFMLAVAGMHPGREGFTVVEADGYPTEALSRPDGVPPFGSVLPGGEAAGLFSVVGEPELLELGARALQLAGEAAACAGSGRQPHQAVEVG